MSKRRRRTHPPHGEVRCSKKPNLEPLPWWLSHWWRIAFSPTGAKICLCSVQRYKNRSKFHKLPKLTCKTRIFLCLFKWSSRYSHWLVFRAVVLKLYYASELLRELVKTQIAGYTHRVSDLVETGAGPKFAFLTNFQVMVMLLAQGPYLGNTG